MRKNKSLPMPNIHPGCVIKMIDDSGSVPRWKTIGRCFDAPNPIAALLREHGLRAAWVFDCLGNKRMVTL